MGNDLASDIHCDITMDNDIAMCTYHGMAMYHEACYYPLLLCILCSIPNCVIFVWVVWNKNKNKFVFDQSGLEDILVVFV